MADFRSRSANIEMMDDLNCAGDVVRQTLRELDAINRLLGGNAVTIDGIKRLLKGHENRSFAIADLGCGSGDLLRRIRDRCLASGWRGTFVGIDANPFIIQYAREHTDDNLHITYEALDIFSDDFRKRQFDIVTGTLFFHHFTNDELANFFRQLYTQVKIGFVINDIHRHWFAYYSIRWLTAIWSKSPMVKSDAPLSVLRAFKKHELEQILKRAGITSFSIRWMWAFRWQVIVKKVS
jgi:2-polyprenyl-3-methyl-5-hydroxy-6-metoxy-1,4-benzoquinol methylase